MTAAGDWHSVEAHAKVNLRLCVFPPYPDGYHPLETIFCRISLSDRVRARRVEGTTGVEIRITGEERVPEGPDNLAVRAAETYLRYTGETVGIELELIKRIPAGAGLGGGSSDAAAVLRLMNATGEMRLPIDELQRLAIELGADVPFFLADCALAVGWSRGERMISIPPLPSAPVLLLVPDARVATTDAYRWWDEDSGGRSSELANPLVIDPDSLTTWAEMAELARNDFEPVVFARHPELGEWRERLDATEPVIALLAGSGSGLFGVYASEEARDAAVRSLRASGDGVRVLPVNAPV